MDSLNTRLALAFALVSLIAVILVGLILARRITTEFREFLGARERELMVDFFSDYYRERGSWSGVDVALREALRGGQLELPRPPLPMALLDRSGRVVLASGMEMRMGHRSPRWQLAQGIPLEVEGEVVGTLLIDRRSMELGLVARRFLGAVNRALLGAALLASLAAVVVGVLLSRSLTRPLRELTNATRAVARGDLNQQVAVRSEDELGQLATSFNQMSAELRHARDLRQQMTADIAHDLRTPLSIILGHAEALAEGVLPPKPETFALIHDEARRLKGLIEQLRTLSLAEAGELSLNLALMAAQELLQRAALAHRPRAEQKGIDLRLNAPPDLPKVKVDADRMAQVLGNLLDNALRYTPEGGEIELAARLGPNASPPATGTRQARPSAKPTTDSAQRVLLAVRDSGPGVPQEDLERIFERFYRGDKARQRDAAGSGLGLAIARSIVEEHGGRMWAESHRGGGLTVWIELPAVHG